MPSNVNFSVDRRFQRDFPTSYSCHGDVRRYLDGHSETKWGHERDSRRQNLYDAERAFSNRTDVARFPWEKPDTTLEEVADFVKDICSSAWWQRRYDTLNWTIHDGRGMKNARGGTRRSGGIMKLPRKARTPLVILHEMTHTVIPKPHAHHGRLFAARFAELIGWRLGDHYETVLKECYRDHNVKFHPHNELQVSEYYV